TVALKQLPHRSAIKALAGGGKRRSCMTLPSDCVKKIITFFSKEDRQMNKAFLFSIFAVAISWSTAVVFAQEQAPAPSFKEGDTWQFNISRKGQLTSSTEQNEGMYELSVTQGAVKLYDVNGGQKNEKPIN